MDRPAQIQPFDLPETMDAPALLELIAHEELQQLQDTLAEIHSLAMVITDPHGNPLTLPSRELSVCSLIRSSSAGFEHCMEHSRFTLDPVAASRQPRCRACASLGVQRDVIPIVVEGLHLANWWASRLDTEAPSPEHIQAYAKRIDMDPKVLMAAMENRPEKEMGDIQSLLAWAARLIERLALMGYRSRQLSSKLSRINSLEDALAEQRSQMEGLVEERTSELISANNRLQLEVLERELVEEQISRKSMVLDAINHILQHNLSDVDHQTLTQTFLAKAVHLTGSANGFIAVFSDDHWTVSAQYPPGDSAPGTEPVAMPQEAEIIQIWRRLLAQGSALSVSFGPETQPPWRPLAKSFPDLESLLVVSLGKSQEISGFIAVAGNDAGYALIDQNDVESLCQVFVETILRKRSEEAKSLSERRLSMALESTNEGLWDYAPANGHMYYSPRWFAMLGYLADEFPETMETWRALTHPDDLGRLENAMDKLISCHDNDFIIEVRMLSRSGQWHWIQVRGKTVSCSADGNVDRIVGTLIDISKYKQVEMALQKANDELQRLAALDDLTQIANRRRFDDRLAQEWRRARRDNKYLAVIICDIDHFKKYNDTYGHLKGDDALYAVAQAIHTALKRPMDLVARYGGEEFAMILPGTDIVGAERVANEVKEAVAELAIVHESSSVGPTVTLSFGVAALIPTVDLPSKILIETADRALYRAKAGGRDQVCCVSTDQAENGDGQQP